MGRKSPETPSDVFRGWRVNPNSIFGDGIRSAAKEEGMPETAHGCLVPLSEAGALPRGINAWNWLGKKDHNLDPLKTSGREISVSPLDKTYHGCHAYTADLPRVPALSTHQERETP